MLAVSSAKVCRVLRALGLLPGPRLSRPPEIRPSFYLMLFSVLAGAEESGRRDTDHRSGRLGRVPDARCIGANGGRIKSGQRVFECRKDRRETGAKIRHGLAS